MSSSYVDKLKMLMGFQLSTTDNLKFVLHFARISLPLHPKASRAVPERVTRQPSFGNHGGQYDAEATFINFKTFQIMQQQIYYIRYAPSTPRCKAEAGPVCELITIRHSLTSSNDEVLMSLLSMMASPSASPILSDTILPTIDLSSVTNNLYLSILLPCRLLLARGEHVIPYN